MGVLTAIQRFSLHDGPGIRSTVFFKGCNMRCAWCHNPETLSPAPEVLYYESKCVGCGACAAVCPSHTVAGGKMVYDRSKCDDGGRCAQVCFSGALEVCGFEADVDRVLFEVMQDEAYYARSGGGVTLSGGEVPSRWTCCARCVRAACTRPSRAISTSPSPSWSRCSPSWTW